MIDNDPILKVRDERELNDLLENEREQEEYNRLMRIPQDGSQQARYAFRRLTGYYGVDADEKDYGKDQYFPTGQGDRGMLRGNPI